MHGDTDGAYMGLVLFSFSFVFTLSLSDGQQGARCKCLRRHGHYHERLMIATHRNSTFLPPTFYLHFESLWHNSHLEGLLSVADMSVGRCAGMRQRRDFNQRSESTFQLDSSSD